MTNIIRNNRKIIIIVLVFLELISLFLVFKSFSSKNALQDNIKSENSLHRKQFSMYTENENGTYDEYTSSNLFPTGYFVNLEKSNCVDMNNQKVDNVLSSTNGMVTVTSNKTVFCYLYFDLPKPSVTLTVKTDGTENTLPTYNHYKQTLSCDEGTTSTFNVKYQRLEISNVGKENTNCNLNYTNDTSTYTLLKTKVEELNTTNNNGYRYSGKEPENFVWFNNEKWRIIGSIPVCLTSGCGDSDTRLVKIIRNESIGGIAYDAKSSGYTGAWGSNTLYTLLNSYYYGKLDATGSSPCFGNSNGTYALCNYTNKGISSISTDYYGRMVKEVYWNTGATSNSSTASAAYTSETSTQTISGRIGLMSASDYGYAGTDYTNAMNSITFANNTNTNWLYGQSYEWTSIQDSSDAYYARGVYSNGYVSYRSAYVAFAVRPVLYLDSEVYIISGDGTESSPYILGM